MILILKYIHLGFPSCPSILIMDLLLVSRITAAMRSLAHYLVTDTS